MRICSKVYYIVDEVLRAGIIAKPMMLLLSLPCSMSLPDWLPGKVVHLMVEEFSRRLREELNNKLTDNNNLQGRVGMSDTGRISMMDSIRSGELEPTFGKEDLVSH
jgi:hypothetical protein